MKLWSLFCLLLLICSCGVVNVEKENSCEDCNLGELSPANEKLAMDLVGSIGDVAYFVDTLQSPQSQSGDNIKRGYGHERRPLRDDLKNSIPSKLCFKAYEDDSNDLENFTFLLDGTTCPAFVSYTLATNASVENFRGVSKRTISYRKIFKADNRVVSPLAKVIINEKYEDNANTKGGIFTRTSLSNLSVSGMTQDNRIFNLKMTETKKSYEPLASVDRSYSYKRVDRLEYRGFTMVLLNHYVVEGGDLKINSFRINGLEISKSKYFKLLQDGEQQFGLRRYTDVPSQSSPFYQ